MKMRKNYGLLALLLIAMMLTGFSIVNPSGKGSSDRADSTIEESSKAAEEPREETVVQSSEQKEYAALGGYDEANANVKNEETKEKQEIKSPETQSGEESMGNGDGTGEGSSFSNWKEVSDAKGNLFLAVPKTAERVEGTEQEPFLVYEWMDEEGNLVGAVKAAAYKGELPERFFNYTDALPESGDTFSYRFDTLTNEQVTWEAWFGYPSGSPDGHLDFEDSDFVHLIAKGKTESGDAIFLELDLQGDDIHKAYEELCWMGHTMLQSVYCSNSLFGRGAWLLILAVIGLLAGILLFARRFMVRKASKEQEEESEDTETGIFAKLKNFEIDTKQEWKLGCSISIPKWPLWITGFVLLVTLLLSFVRGSGPIRVMMPSLEQLAGIWHMLKAPMLVVAYSTALTFLLEMWERWSSARQSGTKIGRKAGFAVVVTVVSVLFIWALFSVGVLQKTRDAIILALSGKSYMIPFLTILDRIKAYSYLIAVMAVLICVALIVKSNLNLILEKLRVLKENTKKEPKPLEQETSVVETPKIEEPIPQSWKRVQTESNGLSFLIPSNAKWVKSNVVVSALGAEADKSVYMFNEETELGVPKGGITVALYGEPAVGLNSKFMEYEELLDSLRYSVRAHENYAWTEKKIIENGITWDVWHGIYHLNGSDTAKSDYMFACCDFGDKTFGYMGASGEVGYSLRENEVSEFLYTLLKGIKKRR